MAEETAGAGEGGERGPSRITGAGTSQVVVVLLGLPNMNKEKTRRKNRRSNRFRSLHKKQLSSLLRRDRCRVRDL